MRSKLHPYHRRKREQLKKRLVLETGLIGISLFALSGFFFMGTVTLPRANKPTLPEAESITQRIIGSVIPAVNAYYVPTEPKPDTAVITVVSPPKYVEPKQKVRLVSSGMPTQEQKDATEVACAHAYEKHGSSSSRGEFMSMCYTDLLAIAKHESGFRCDAIGDGGMSHGCFQIYRTKHPHVSVEQARDYVFAVNWTIERLMNNGYGEGRRTYGITSHNGITFNKDGSTPHGTPTT
jgi:hypothetical protein